MTYQLDIKLSPELEQFRDKIEGSIKPFIALIPKQNRDLTWWQSKLGGLPYLPKGCEYPTDPDGNPLFLLVQINLEETPYLEGFPSQGILQFYIANDDAYGADFDNATPQQRFRVVYYQDIAEKEEDLVTDFSFLPQPKSLPFRRSCSLQFEKQAAPVSITDCEFEEFFGVTETHFFAQFGENKDDVQEEYAETFSAAGHKMGGYAYFTQYDPRLQIAAGEKYLLLLQIDTDHIVDIMWGDTGVGHFFILPKDLENLDFSRVLYHWDCY